MSERKLLKLSKHDKTGKLGDRTYKEVLFGAGPDASGSPLAAGAAYVAGKLGLLDKKKPKQKFKEIDGMKIAVRKAQGSAEKP